MRRDNEPEPSPSNTEVTLRDRSPRSVPEPTNYRQNHPSAAPAARSRPGRLTRRAGSYVQKDAAAWLSRALAARLGHYRTPAPRQAPADLLPTHLLTHAALLTDPAHL